MGTPARKNLDGLFAKALGEVRPSIEDGDASTSPTQGLQEVITATRTLGRGLSAKPRRMSRSPAKSNVVEKVLDAPDLGGIANPFAKKGGLRRSPTLSSQVDPQTGPSQEEVDPFARKTRVRRSPESSQVVPMPQELGGIGTALQRSPVILQTDVGMQDTAAEPTQEQRDEPPRGNALKRSPIPSQVDAASQEVGPVEKTGLRRSPRLPSVDSAIQELRPIKKTALRRSPLAQADAMAHEFSPVKKAGLRRSPPVIRPSVSLGRSELQIEQHDISGQAKQTLRRSPMPDTVLESIETQVGVPEQFDTTPPGPPPSKALQTSPQLPPEADIRYLQDVSDRPPKAPEPVGKPLSAAVPELLEAPLEAPEPTQNTQAAENDKIPRLIDEAQKSKPIQPVLKAQEPIIAAKPLFKTGISQESSTSQATSSHLQKRNPKSKPPQPKVSSPEEIILRRHPDPPLDKEPELPPTPTQLGLKDPVVTTPPAGIHDTPSKRARRIKALNAKIRSSPLKPRDERPTESVNASTMAIPIPSLVPDSQQPEKLKRRKSARFLVPVDPYAEKKNERDALLKQLQKIQADIATGKQEAERLRLLHDQKKSSSDLKASEDLVAMLLRSKAPEPSTLTKPAPNSIFKSIEAFLPFHSRRRQATKPTALSILDKPLPSFLPNAMDDPLPYLQALSPLTYTSTINLLPPTPSSPNDDTSPSQLQQHLISASHSSGLFFSRFTLTVNTSNFSTPSLEISKLDPASESELGPFLRKVAEKRNLSVFCWAMSCWTEVALKRAGFWCAVNAEFGTAEARSRSLSNLKLKGKRKRGDDHEDDNDVQQGGWSRKQLLPMMSRTHFEVAGEDNGVLLRIEWRLEFDWVGDCESEISALASVPGACKFPDLYLVSRCVLI